MHMCGCLFVYMNIYICGNNIIIGTQNVFPSGECVCAHVSAQKLCVFTDDGARHDEGHYKAARSRACVCAKQSSDGVGGDGGGDLMAHIKIECIQAY